MIQLKSLFLTIVLAFGLQAGAQSKEEFIPVMVETQGNRLLGIDDFEVFQGSFPVERTREGYYLCRPYRRGYVIAPRRARTRSEGYFVVRSNGRISREMDRRIYFKKDADGRSLSFPIDIQPRDYASGDPIKIVVRCGMK